MARPYSSWDPLSRRPRSAATAWLSRSEAWDRSAETRPQSKSFSARSKSRLEISPNPDGFTGRGSAAWENSGSDVTS